MKIISCVPLPGAGVIARYGDLVAVKDGRGPAPDELLSALAAVASAAGDGRDLVRLAARAALGGSGQQARACAGVTADGGMAVLVHGRATATVWVEGEKGDEGDSEVSLTASDPVTPVTRTFTGAMVTVGEGTASRLHLRVSLIGWLVEVSDLGSANGSVLQTPGAKRTLAPFEPMVLEPGARIGIGHRSMQYVAYQGVLS